MGTSGTTRSSGLNGQAITREEFRRATTIRNPIIDRRGEARTEAEYRQAVADFERQRAARNRSESRRGSSTRSTSRRRGGR